MNTITLNQDQDRAVNILTEWYSNKDKENEIAILEGYAGTGKTFITTYIIDELKINKVLVSAPTNKAVSVIKAATGLAGKTIHQILGLNLDMDLSDFDPNNPKFSPKRPVDADYKLIVIDEASMINKELYKQLKELAEKRNLKILFLGDRFQLPPVKEKVSSVFTDPKTKAILNEVVRQGDDNPNSELIQLCINDIKNNTDSVLDYMNKNFQVIAPSDINSSKGFINLNKISSSYTISDYFYSQMNNFLDNETKYMAFTNANVELTIKNLRTKIFAFDDYINNCDSLMGYVTASIKNGKQSIGLITNSVEYNIANIREMTISEGLDGYQLALEEVITGANRYINLVNLSDEQNKAAYIRVVSDLMNKAKALGRQHWKNYFNFIHNALALETIFKNGIFLKKKELDFSYGFTVHKSQGSTFNNSIVNLSNINNKTRERDIARRLTYVALSLSLIHI